jgi:hypothetical protein
MARPVPALLKFLERGISTIRTKIRLVLAAMGRRSRRKYKFDLAARPVEDSQTPGEDYDSTPEFEKFLALAIIQLG